MMMMMMMMTTSMCQNGDDDDDDDVDHEIFREKDPKQHDEGDKLRQLSIEIIAFVRLRLIITPKPRE
jgi:hypothetical protein